MEFLFAYLAGVLTLINPCVLPVLPIVLATALQASPRGPLALAAGMCLTFVIVGVGVTAFGRSVGLHEGNVGRFGAWLMIGFGLILLLPAARSRFAAATAGLSAQADAGLDNVDRGRLSGQFLGGMLLGIVWSPCVGPTLGGAIALASQGENLGRVTAIMVAFGLGVASIVLALGYGARSVLTRHRDLMRKIASVSQPVMGVMFLLVGFALLMRWHHVAEAWLLDRMPDWLLNLSVMF